MSQATLGQSPYRNSSLFSGYYLDERIDDLEEWECDQQARDTFEELQRLWELEGDLVSGYKEDELLSSWIDEVLEILGFGTQSETTVPGSGGGYNDRLLFDSKETRRDAAKRAMDGNQEAMYEMASAVLEAKQWDADFSKKFDEQRSYRDASHQIKYYLEHTPERLQWGVLTDGKKWRLYGTKNYATEIYYEVDLPELLEAGDVADFKYFYAFFRPEAFREVAGTTFLDTVWNESETAAQELGEDLQDNVFTALRVLGEGFIHTNDLDIDPDDEAARAELKEQSLVLLYRLMFVLYAESRGLIHPEDPDAQTEYEENFSLDQIRLDIHDQITSGDSYDDWSGYATQIWGQLEDLFRLIDEGQESLGIPPYNGGLFDDEAHTFLAENEVADRYIAEVIHRLGTTEDEAGDPVPADYADLDTRHLGSIYEGLLEHEFRIASEPYAAVAEDGGQVWKPGTDVSVAEAVETVEEGELYVVNDDGERKATGAYYTPDYVVNYIVEETIDPLLDDIRDELEADGLDPSDQAYFGRFYSEVQDLKILDPAMGSAHFLTSAMAYLTEQVMEIVREQERQGRDEQEIRRTIAKECIYGVDVNGMAVELGKLSMWLETLAADKPLAFLDHHVKTGNSLVGSDITEVLSDDAQENGGQLTLTQAFAHARQQTLEHVMELMEELLAIDNDDLTDIKSMEELYDEIRDDPLYQRLFEIANVHTAEEFGLDVPEDVYEEMAGAIEDEDDWEEIRGEDWFNSAQVMAGEENFFHWELEFPEVFFGEDGTKLEGAGFDAVIGNPPYVNSKYLNEAQKQYLECTYSSTTGRWDTYLPMTERAIEIASDSVSYIEPSMFFRREYGEGLREFISNSDSSIREIIDFSDLSVFESATNYVCIITIDATNTGEFPVRIPESIKKFASSEKIGNEYYLDNSDLDSEPWEVIPADVVDIIESIPNDFIELGEVTDSITEGIHSGRDNVYYVSEQTVKNLELEDELLKPLLKGKHVKRYQPPETDLYVIWPYDGDELIKESVMREKYPKTYEYLENNRDELEERTYLINSGYEWYELWRKREHRIYENPKILLPMITDGSNFTIDDSEDPYFFNTKAKSMKIQEGSDIDLKTLLGLLNSKLLEFVYKGIAPPKRGGYRAYTTGFMSQLEVPNTSSKKLVDLVNDMLEKNRETNRLNLSLLDHLGSYSDGLTIADIGLTQPTESSADSILQETTEQKPNLRVGEAITIRESNTTVEIRFTARYKPDDEDAHETDQWGYTETNPLPALRITDLTETEADLIEAFVPVAVDEAGGFANFRETATKTNSLVDRLRKLTLPAVEDVQDGLESYIETKERAEELEAKIEKTDELIDEIVYELYGLTDEEIEIVEEAVSE